MTRFLGYIAASLDARIADANGSVDWLAPFSEAGSDFGFGAFYETVDALIMGRASYEFVAGQPEWPYPGRQSYVVTTRKPNAARGDVEAVAADFAALRERLTGQHECVWIMGGGQTLRGAMDVGMLDKLKLFVMPVVLGGGPLVFADGPPKNANLTDHKIWPGGVAELTYSF